MENNRVVQKPDFTISYYHEMSVVDPFFMKPLKKEILENVH